MKKEFIKFLPYITAFSIGIFLYFLALLEIAEQHHELLVNIAATFFSVPLLVVFYEAVKAFSQKKLTEEIFDYAKEQIDEQLIAILIHLRKIIFFDEEKKISTKTINAFLALSKDQIEDRMKEKKYLGFQVFKYWKTNEDHVRELLKNSFILGKMENDHIILLISILKNLKKFEKIQSMEDLYLSLRQKAKGYKIVDSNVVKSAHTDKLQRKMLLKCSKNNNFTVCDSGDIPQETTEKSLNYYKINKKFLSEYAQTVFDLLTVINAWLRKTGNEFILDTVMVHLDKTVLLISEKE